MIRVGTRKLASKTGSFKDVKVVSIIPHPQYRAPSTYNDIALLKLESKLTYAANILPACLHTTKELTTIQRYLTALGWGKIDFAGPAADNLQKVVLRYAPFSDCSAKYSDVTKDRLPNGLRDDIQVCAGGEVGKDTCQVNIISCLSTFSLIQITDQSIVNFLLYRTIF